MARIHVRSWQEAYRGLVADEILDRPDFVERRERFWTAALSDERYAMNRVAVAERDGEMAGIATAGPAIDPDAHWPAQLFVLYVLAAAYGTGAGRGLLAAVIGNDDAALWVADPNPRAQASTAASAPAGRARKHDCDLRIDEIRMVRHEHCPAMSGGRRRTTMPPIAGEFVTERLAGYDGGRPVTVYVPPAPAEAVVFAGDGQLISQWGESVEAADAPPAMIVGIHRRSDETLRLHEYSPGFEPERFAAHEKFFRRGRSPVGASAFRSRDARRAHRGVRCLGRRGARPGHRASAS